MRRLLPDVLIAVLLGLMLGMLLTFISCVPVPAPRPPVPPVAPVTEAQCRAIWQEELHRPIDPGGLTGCLTEARAGGTTETIRANVRRSPEWAQLHAAHPDPPVTPTWPAACVGIHVSGREFVCADGRPFFLRGVTAFQLLEQIAHGRRAVATTYLDWAAGNGFNVVRVLTMAVNLFDLSPEDGEAALPILLDLAAQRGLVVQVTALADTGLRSVAVETHLQRLSEACTTTRTCLMEVANEPYHSTQESRVHDPAQLARWARIPQGLGIPTALGAAENDETAIGPGGDWIANHLDRSRDDWNMIRRVKEQHDLEQREGRPVWSSEPAKFREPGTGGETDPALAFAFGVLGVGFGIDTTYHCQACLGAEIPGPRQLECAKAFIEGAKLLPAGNYQFFNTRAAGGPVSEAHFRIKAGGSADPTGTVDRVFSFLGPDGRWRAVLLGVSGDPGLQFQSGFRRGATLADRGAVQVIEIVH